MKGPKCDDKRKCQERAVTSWAYLTVLHLQSMQAELAVRQVTLEILE